MRTITRFLRRFLILLIVFVIGVAGTAFLMNNETTDDRSDMNNPTLPEVMVDFNGTLANRMYGYRQPMEADFVRDSVHRWIQRRNLRSPLILMRKKSKVCPMKCVLRMEPRSLRIVRSRVLTAQDLMDICAHRSRSVPVF